MTTSTSAPTRCERHVYTGVECSGEATFVLHRHGRTHLICESFARHIWAIGRTRCYVCRQPIWKHWETEKLQ